MRLRLDRIIAVQTDVQVSRVLLDHGCLAALVTSIETVTYRMLNSEMCWRFETPRGVGAQS